MRTDVEGRLRFRVTFSDVDAVQFFFADYYRWMERAHAELMASCGYPRAQSMQQRRGFPVVESGCTYEKRAVLDDLVEVVARFSDMTERSFRVAYTFSHQDGAVIARGFTQHVSVDLDVMKACPVPTAFRGSEATMASNV